MPTDPSTRVPSIIESPANPRIKAAAHLRDRQARTAAGTTLVDGGREALRALGSGAVVETAFVCRSLVTTPEARRAVEKLTQDMGPFGAPIEVVEVGERAYARLAFGDRSDGVVLAVRIPVVGLDDIQVTADSLVVVTEDVEKPGNLGAILRSADAVGADAVVAVGGTDLFNPNVIRASVGTVFSVPVAAASPVEAAAWVARHGLRAVAAVVDAERLYVDADLRGGVAIVLGSEAHGLSDAWRGPGVEAVRLPMRGIADSLNVSATAAVLLYEAWRQRRGTAESGGSAG